MIKHLSISLRLTVWYAFVSAAGLTVFGVVMWFVLANSMISWKDRTLQMRAARMEATLHAATADSEPALQRRLENVAGILPEGEWIQIVAADGHILFPAPSSDHDEATIQPCASALYRDRMVDRERFRELCHPVLYRAQQAYLLVPSPLSEDRILLGNFTTGLYRMVPILLLVSGLGGYLLSRRALAPVDLVIAEARAITAHDLSRRLTLPAANDQLRRLAVEWNGLLSRIESAMVRIAQFTADASHELRSPIAFIRATAEYQLATEPLDGEMRETLHSIHSESKLATDLLEGLLLLARLDAEQVPKPAEPADAFALARELALHFAPSLQKRGQSLSLSIPSQDRLPVRMGVDALRRVLIAILDNAIKYTPEGGSICVCYEAASPACLRITDTGAGIAAKHLDRIFDRFFRVDDARTDVSQGVGLGLSIAKRLMEQYDGSIAVTSQLGKGTSVVLHFPA